MSERRNIFGILAFTALFAGNVAAEVFWPAFATTDETPLLSSTAKVSSRNWAQAFHFDRLWHEPMTANGVPLELQGGISTLNWQEFVAALTAFEPAPDLFIDEGNLLLAWPGEKTEQRVLVSFIATGVPLLIFAMEIPAAPLPSPIWPDSLPLPPGSTPERVYEYPKRQALYAEFTHPGEPSTVMREISSALDAGSWNAVGMEANTPNGSGELYVNTQRGEILLFSLFEATAVYYRRPLGR